MWKEVTELLYPPECPVCQQILTAPDDRKRHIHRQCYRKLRRITEPMCRKCGKPVLSVQQEYCFDCMRRPRAYESGHGLWRYDDVSAASVFAYKYDGKRSYADFYGEALGFFYKDWITSLHVQQMIPVPLSKKKERQRGFNQAALLAEKLSEQVQLPVNTKGLVRIHSTAPQKALGKHDREANLLHAFAANPKYLKDIRRVLLIDDIYTTGSTIQHCTRALQQAGVEKVWFLTLCIGGNF